MTSANPNNHQHQHGIGQSNTQGTKIWYVDFFKSQMLSREVAIFQGGTTSWSWETTDLNCVLLGSGGLGLWSNVAGGCDAISGSVEDCWWPLLSWWLAVWAEWRRKSLAGPLSRWWPACCSRSRTSWPCTPPSPLSASAAVIFKQSSDREAKTGRSCRYVLIFWSRCWFLVFFYANLGLFPPIASTLNQVLVLIGTRKKWASVKFYTFCICEAREVTWQSRVTGSKR